MNKHALWNKPTLQASAVDINKELLKKKTNVKIKHT